MYRFGILLLLFSAFTGILSCSETPEDPGEVKEINAAEKKEQMAGEELLHPDFLISEAELQNLVKRYPEKIQTLILEKPEHFLECLLLLLSLPEYAVILVDKEHALPRDYVPEDLVSLSDYSLTLNRNDLRVRAVIMPDLLAMAEAARLEDITLPLSSTYRSYDYQEGLWKRNVETLGLEQASRESAKPGTSQHQLGTTIDFGSITDDFADTEAGKWLAARAWEFGFSMSYPQGYESITGYRYESWHFRYIGRAGTYVEHAFFNGIQQYMLEFLYENRSFLIEKRIRG